jgi:predicted Ser/Thr protein kinase
MRILVVLAVVTLVQTGFARDSRGVNETGTPVCVSNSPDMQTRAIAQSLAGKMFAEAGVKIDWRTMWSCPAGAIRIRFSESTLPSLYPGAWAYALPYEGSTIVVFNDRVQRWAQSSGSPTRLTRALLAYIMVHEIIHVLQGVVRHSEEGVMKPKFTPADLDRMFFAALPFTAEDRMLLQQGLARRKVNQLDSRRNLAAIVERILWAFPVTPELWRQVDELYHAVLDLPTANRPARLEQADPEVRREVESLLAQEGSALNHPAWEVPAEIKPGTQLGPYKIEASIGAGGMGQVCRAVDSRLGRKVAIKIAGRQFGERLEREARAISALNHPHICTLYDVGPDYLVMEYVEGETLAARIKKGALPIGEVLRYGAQIADAPAEAHSKTVTHRDLKPANVMISKSRVKVLDFGLAKFSEPGGTHTQTGAVLGTLAYMAPEQMEGKATDARTDIYALGLTLYEMATGKRVVLGQPLALDGLPVRFAHVVERVRGARTRRPLADRSRRQSRA